MLLLLDLPSELIKLITSELTMRELIKIAVTCKQIRALLKGELLFIEKVRRFKRSLRSFCWCKRGTVLTFKNPYTEDEDENNYVTVIKSQWRNRNIIADTPDVYFGVLYLTLNDPKLIKAVNATDDMFKMIMEQLDVD